MAKRPPKSSPDPVDPDLVTPDVEVGRGLRDGRAYVMPAGWRRLPSEVREALLECQDIAHRIAFLQQQLDTAVPEARALGASWGQVGVAVTMTPEGSRLRWREAAEELSATLSDVADRATR